MDAHQLGLEGCDLSVTDFVITSSVVVVRLACTSSEAACPCCGAVSHRTHSRYLRTIADLACHGRRVLIRIEVRRFRCPSPSCPRIIFCERLPGLAEVRARTTARLSDTHRLVGLVLGGEPGSRLADSLAIPTSPDTILRRVKETNDLSAPPPRFVGIDDWAWRKGQRYGTIVVDLERGRVVDLLPDRDAETVKKWLEAHPGVELISRDRGPTYTRAASEAAPQAKQVADRWHLLKNLREAIERLFQRQAEAIAQALKPSDSAPPKDTSNEAPSVEDSVPEGSPKPDTSSDQEAKSPRQQAAQAKRQRRVERFELVQDRHRQGHSARRIARELGLSRCSVRHYLRSTTCPDWKSGGHRRSRWDEHCDWIDARLAAGEMNASAMHRELVAKGYVGSYGSVRRYVAKRLAAAGKRRSSVHVSMPATPALPTARQLSFDWVCRPEEREPEVQARIDAIRVQSHELSAALDAADDFANLIRKRSEGTLAGWLTRTLESPCPELRGFAEGIRREEAAVNAAVTGPWSNGPVEGHVNRLKLVKRSMYGKAGFQLLRARVIQVA